MACANGQCSISPQPATINQGANMAGFNTTPTVTTPNQTSSLGWLDNLRQGIFGKPGETTNLPKFTKEQDAFRQMLLGSAGNQLQNPKEQFNPQPGIQQLMQMLLGSGSQQNNPQTQQLLNQTLQGSQTPQGYGFEPIENRARQQFEQRTIPGLAERFSSLGSGGSQRSSAFTGALGGAASDLEGQLAALRSQYGLQERQQLGQEQGQRQNLLGTLFNQNKGQQALQQNLLGQLLGTQGQQQGLNQNLLLNILQQGLQSPFESLYSPPTTGLLGGLAGGFGNGLSKLLGG